MAAVSETIVREYFEQNEFLVRQFGKYVAPAGREDDDFDFVVLNPHAQPAATPMPGLLSTGDLAYIRRAIVVVRPWHSEVFSPAMLSSTPRIFRFLGKKAFQQAARDFAESGTLLTILVVPALPTEAQARKQSIDLIRSHGVDAVLSFRTILADLVREVEPNRNYQKSDLLQTLRILKQHGFFKEPQLELFKARLKSRGPRSAGDSGDKGSL